MKYKINRPVTLCFDNVNVIHLANGDTYEPKTNVERAVFKDMVEKGQAKLYVQEVATPVATKVAEPKEKAVVKKKVVKKTSRKTSKNKTK